MTNPINGHWPALSKDQIKARVFEALNANVSFTSQASSVLGVPASSLDPQVFYNDAPFLTDAPFLSALVSNPNHIGCHTLGQSEPFFSGTHGIERELIDLCSQKILQSNEPCDGYVAAGGTEANIQAVWMHRNYFMHTLGCRSEEVVLLCSEDSHYSVYKAANLLNVGIEVIRVDDESRCIDDGALNRCLHVMQANGIKAVIVFCNMMTTMFGSVDDPRRYLAALKAFDFAVHVHLDGAYGGFYQPFSGVAYSPDFRIEEVMSVTLDAHKMVQAPYGTGLFICRKGLLHHTCTAEASYVSGADYTLSGSRSGANAIAVWMILMTYGREGWTRKISELANRANQFASSLEALGVAHFRADGSNIITIRAHQVPHAVARQYGLVPDHHENPKWYKVVVMEHVKDEHLTQLKEALTPHLK